MGFSPELCAVLIAAAIVMSAAIQIAGLIILGRDLKQITAAVSINVLQGRRIEEVLREMRESLRP